MPVSTISAEMLIFLQPDLIGWYIITSWSVLCKNYIVLFKVKVTVSILNYIESLCILYLLYHWSLGNQRKCADLLFIVTKPTATKWAYADSSTLTYTITRHTTRGGVVISQGDKPCFRWNLAHKYWFYAYARISPQWLSELRQLWLNVSWQVACELISG